MSRSGLHAFARKYSTASRMRVGDWGDFASGALSGVFSAAHAGVEESRQDDQQKKSAGEAAVLLSASAAADGAATLATAQACFSALRRAPSAAADAQAARAAQAAQDAAGVKLLVDQIPARVAMAKKALDDATAKWRAMKPGQPGLDFAKCKADAAQATFNKASGLQITKQVSDDAGAKSKQASGNFWTDSLVGPVPGWGVVTGVVGVGAILWRVLRGRWGF